MASPSAHGSRPGPSERGSPSGRLRCLADLPPTIVGRSRGPWDPARMSRRLRSEAAHGPATLLLARVENMHRVADTLAPEDVLRLLTSVLDAIEVRIAAQGGHLVTWDPSSIEGATAVCAWFDDSQTARLDIRGIARDV